MTIATAALMAAACGDERAHRAALEAGRADAMPCGERFHEESHTYAECVRYRAQAASTADDWRKLGAYTTGWVAAALVGEQGDADAQRAARELLAPALHLQAELRASDRELCALVELDCRRLANMQRALGTDIPTTRT